MRDNFDSEDEDLKKVYEPGEYFKRQRKAAEKLRGLNDSLMKSTDAENKAKSEAIKNKKK